MNNYNVQWHKFQDWAQRKGVKAIPANPEHVAIYLSERHETRGHKPATLKMAAAAISYVHKAALKDDPCASTEVKRILRCATRKAGKSQRQAEALTEEAFEAIRTVAQVPRRGRGGRMETPETARIRGNLDIALISLMRDAMLRVSEASAVKWQT